MAWLVEVLLRNRQKIRDNVTDSDSFSNPYVTILDAVSLDEILDRDYEDTGEMEPSQGKPLHTYDDYNDLLLVEQEIARMYKEDLLSVVDMSIINHMSDGTSLTSAEEFIGKNRYAISLHFSSICKRIAYFLGGYFTDEGLIDKVSRENNLTPNQINILREFMSGNQKDRTKL